jgi:hypothetical protein
MRTHRQTDRSGFASLLIECTKRAREIPRQIGEAAVARVISVAGIKWAKRRAKKRFRMVGHFS